ncbi:MAG TPA: phage terminase large subunit, partial [Vicinamibacterales bacterium]
GMHLGILDDPIKNAEEAASDVIGERNREWWSSTWYTRQEPGAALVVIMTRWPGAGDLVGWLYEQEQADDQPERWHVVSFEAEKTAEAPVVPETCTIEADERSPGDALCPERYPIDKLKKIAARIGSFFYGSLFQQRAVHREGKMFKWEWWRELPAAPVVTTLVRYWDLAGTEPKKKGHDPDYTASTLAGRMQDTRTAILDVTEFRESIGQRDAKIEEVAREDRAKYGLSVRWWFEKEAGIGGEDRMTSLVRRIQALGITVHVEPATGSKLLRAEPLAAAAEAGNIALGPDNPQRPWRERFRSHMADFSATCAHDDIADSASGAFNKLSAYTPGTWGSSTFKA